jgi:hypothetical protein
MRRRTKRLLFLITPLALGAVGIAVWLAWFPPGRASALSKRLVGRWEGSGKVSGELSMTSTGGLLGGAETVTTTCTVQAEFRPDGTYTWNEQHQGDGISMNFWLPKEGAPPARWEVVGARGNQLTVRMHTGDAVLDFQGENAFTMALPESTKGSGTITFNRPDKSLEGPP